MIYLVCRTIFSKNLFHFCAFNRNLQIKKFAAALRRRDFPIYICIYIHCQRPSSKWKTPGIADVLLHTALNSPSLISPFKHPRMIRPVLNSPTFHISYIILHILFIWPSFKFALRSEGEKGENKTGGGGSLYTVCDLIIGLVISPLISLALTICGMSDLANRGLWFACAS